MNAFHFLRQSLTLSASVSVRDTMGSFSGHLFPGLVFIFQSLKWLYYLCSRDTRYHSSKRHGGRDERNGEIVYNCHVTTFIGRTRTPQPSDSLHMIILTVIGMIGEFITGFQNGSFAHYGNIQHITMYASFALASVAALLCDQEIPGVPDGLDYVTFIIALFIEALLFTYHLHGRTPLDVTVHQFLIILLAVSIAIVLIEWHFNNKILPSILRIYVTLLQGTWFIQVAFILYNPLPSATQWIQHDHAHIILVTCIFCLHLLFAFIFVFGVFICSCSVNHSHPCHSSPTSSYRQLPTNDVES